MQAWCRQGIAGTQLLDGRYFHSHSQVGRHCGFTAQEAAEPVIAEHALHKRWWCMRFSDGFTACGGPEEKLSLRMG